MERRIDFETLYEVSGWLCGLTIAEIVQIGFLRCPPACKSTLNFCSWTKRQTVSNLVWRIELTCRSKTAQIVSNEIKNAAILKIFFLSSLKQRSFDSNTPGNLVRGSRCLCTKNPYANFRPWLTRHPYVNKRISSPDLLMCRQFHRHNLKNQTMLFPATFITTSEKIGVGLEK